MKKPSSWGAFLRHLCTLDYWWAKVITLLGNSVGPLTAPYIPPRKRRALRAEAVPLIAGLCRCFCNDAHRPAVPVTVAVGCAADPWVSRVAPVPIGRIRTLPRGGEHVLNTRTTLTTRVVRFLAWNMPYHAEHHAMPSVPFHKLPTLHNMTAAHLGRVSDGYSEFSKAYVSSFRD